jgi:hypothetical protein
MKLSTHASRIIPAAAAAAVTLAALAATVAALQGSGAESGRPAESSRVQGPPPELLTLRVVKAPPLEREPQLARSNAAGD